MPSVHVDFMLCKSVFFSNLFKYIGILGHRHHEGCQHNHQRTLLLQPPLLLGESGIPLLEELDVLSILSKRSRMSGEAFPIILSKCNSRQMAQLINTSKTQTTQILFEKRPEKIAIYIEASHSLYVSGLFRQEDLISLRVYDCNKLYKITVLNYK